jgi:hypothetical protein
MAKTGLEVLTELLEQVKLLNKRMDLMDQNLKVLMNKERTKAPEPKEPPKIQAVERPEPKKGKMSIELTKKPEASAPKPEQPKAEKKPGVMTSGKLAVYTEGAQTPIPDAVIKIYDQDDRIVKETKTNRGGIWMALLAPGKYVVEISGKFRGKDLTKQNKSIVIPDGVSKFEVV